MSQQKGKIRICFSHGERLIPGCHNKRGNGLFFLWGAPPVWFSEVVWTARSTCASLRCLTVLTCGRSCADGVWPFLAGLAPGARSRFWELVGWGPVGVSGILVGYKIWILPVRAAVARMLTLARILSLTEDIEKKTWHKACSNASIARRIGRRQRKS